MTRGLPPFWRNVLLVVAACVVLPTITADAMPRLLPGSTTLVLAIGVSLAMAAISLNLLLGYAGQLSLGHAALLGTGAFAASIVVDQWRLPMPLGWIAAAVAGGVIALAIGIPALRLRGLYLALVTMVFGLTMQSSVLRWQVFTHGSAGASVPRRILGDRLLTSAPAYLAVTLVLLVAVWLVDRNVLRTKLGRAFRAIREDETAAQAYAIDVTRYKLLAFVLAGAIAGLAGALYGHALGLVNSDTFSLDLSLRIVLFVIIGGIGQRWGVATVAILFGLAPKLPEALAGYDLVFAAAIVMYNVVRLPGGFASLVAELGMRTRSSAHDIDRAEADLLPKLPDLSLLVPSTGGDAGSGPRLEVRGLTVAFGGLRAVSEVSLQVERGTIVGIIGPNGAGKSTLFNAISGFVPTTAGRVLVDGEAVHDLAPHLRARSGLGRTFQHVGLAKDLSVRENILLTQHRAAGYGDLASLLYTPSVARTERELATMADDIVERLGFADRADVPVRDLSGGQRRIVELAAVLATSPKVLMLDEPTAGLAPAAAEDLAERLHELRAAHGQTILLIEHNVPLVLDLCDHVYVLNAGELLTHATPDELSSKPEILEAYLGGVLS